MPHDPDPADTKSWPYLMSSGGSIVIDKNYLVDTFMYQGKGYNDHAPLASPGGMTNSGVIFGFSGSGPNITGTVTPELKKRPMGGPYYFHGGDWTIDSDGLKLPSGTGIVFSPFAKRNLNEAVVYHVQESAISFTGTIDEQVARQPKRVAYFDFVDWENHHKVVEEFIKLEVFYPTTGTPGLYRRVKIYKVEEGIEELLTSEICDGYSFGGSTANDVFLDVHYVRNNRWSITYARGLPSVQPTLGSVSADFFKKTGSSAITDSGSHAFCYTKLLGGKWFGYEFKEPASAVASDFGIKGYAIYQGRIRKDSSGNFVPQIPYFSAERGLFALQSTEIKPLRTDTASSLRTKYVNAFNIGQPLAMNPYATHEELGFTLGNIANHLQDTTPNEIQVEFSSGVASFPNETITPPSGPPYTFKWCQDCENLNGVTLILKRKNVRDLHGQNTASPVGTSGLYQNGNYTYWYGIDGTDLPCQSFDTTSVTAGFGGGASVTDLKGWMTGVTVNLQGNSVGSGTGFGLNTYNFATNAWTYAKFRPGVLFHCYTRAASGSGTPYDSPYNPPDHDPAITFTAGRFWGDITYTLEDNPPGGIDPHYSMQVFIDKFIALGKTSGTISISDQLDMLGLGSVNTIDLTIVATFVPRKTTNLGITTPADVCDLTTADITITPIYDFEEEGPESMPWIESDLPDMEHDDES